MFVVQYVMRMVVYGRWGASRRTFSTLRVRAQEKKKGQENKGGRGERDQNDDDDGKNTTRKTI